MSKKKLDATWDRWVKDNLQRQCKPEEILAILIKNAFSMESIRQSMGDSFPVGSALFGAQDDTLDYEQLANVRLTRADTKLKVKKIDTELLQIYELDNFMSESECDNLIAVIQQRLRPSTISNVITDKYFRTSSTCDLSLSENTLVNILDQKIAETLGVRLPYSEGIQAQRYDVGQEFKAHTDFFEPGTDEYAKYAANLGNRTWTFMVYLNNVVAGGGTRFFSLDKTFTPKQGKAIVWNNLHRDGSVNRDSLHAGIPVESGQKIIITKWFREKGSGPMFY
jgi:prolyl 4-hydroxylase